MRVYSQLKSCSVSEVAAMIEGVLRHCTDVETDRQYTDAHGASIIGFAFAHMLGLSLLLLLQDILGEEKRRERLPDADRRALPLLFWTHVDPGLGRDANRAPPSPTPMRFGCCRPGGQLSCSRAGMSPRVARRSVRCFARVGGLGVVGRRGPLDVVVGRGPAGQQVQGVLRG
ncbi:Tn3 family transposase [Streptomyces griseorubiginosus]|uniref:Tn3 family transposase n=1 Tax=Streptomyces griseorubiginosus TaxID=67304 RepID=UPI0036F0948D